MSPFQRAGRAAPDSTVVPGFTLIELLVSIGVLVILLGLAMSALSPTKSQAKQVACAAEIRSLQMIISSYAVDYKDMFPFALHRGHPDGSFVIGSPSLEVDYETAAALWHLPLLNAFGYRTFDRSLICSADSGTLPEHERMVERGGSGVDPQKVAGTLVRKLSVAMFLDPKALRRASPSWGPRSFKLARHADIVFPSSKASLYEAAPYHMTEFVPETHITPPFPWLLIVGAADGSAAARRTSDVLPGVPARGISRPETALVEAELTKLRFTENGIAGRDW